MPAEGRALISGALSTTAEAAIGDEPGNTRTDPEPSEEAVSQGEGGTSLPLLPALRQGLSRGHPAPCLCAGPCQRGSAGGGRGELRGDRGDGAGGVAGPSPGRPRGEDVQTPAGT